MSWTVGWNQREGVPVLGGVANYGLGGVTLYTGSGGLYRTKILNFENTNPPDNSASNPSPQPPVDVCVINPDNLICL